ncbi:hypothetical protein ABK040_010397 [Willaertia magna]
MRKKEGNTRRMRRRIYAKGGNIEQQYGTTTFNRNNEIEFVEEDFEEENDDYFFFSSTSTCPITIKQEEDLMEDDEDLFDSHEEYKAQSNNNEFSITTLLDYKNQYASAVTKLKSTILPLIQSKTQIYLGNTHFTNTELPTPTIPRNKFDSRTIHLHLDFIHRYHIHHDHNFQSSCITVSMNNFFYQKQVVKKKNKNITKKLIHSLKDLCISILQTNTYFNFQLFPIHCYPTIYSNLQQIFPSSCQEKKRHVLFIWLIQTINY